MRLLVVGLTAVAAHGVSQDQPRPDPPVFTRPPPELVVTASVPVRVPNPMTEKDFARICDILSLSSPQRLLSESAYERYLAGCASLVAQRLTELWKSSYAAGEAMAIRHDYAAYEAARRDLSTQEETAARAVATLDESLFEEIESVLADVQQPQMERARLRRQRQRCSIDESRMVAVMDVVMLLEVAESELGILEELDGLSSTYEMEITPTFVSLDDELRRCRLQNASLLAQQQAAKNRGDQAQLLSLISQRQAAYQQAASLQRRLVERNERFVQDVVATLNDERGEAVKRLYRNRAYYRIFPDALDATGIYQLTLRLPLDDQVRRAIDELFNTYRATQGVIDGRLIAGLNDIDEHTARNFQVPPDEKSREDMRGWREDRWHADLAFVRQVRDLVVPVAGSELEKAIVEHGRLAEATLQSAERDKFPYN
jgi:hypothetical protein